MHASGNKGCKCFQETTVFGKLFGKGDYKLLEKITNVQLNEFLSQFEWFLNGILAKELFSWRFKVYCTNKRKEKNILNGRSHTVAVSWSNMTLKMLAWFSFSLG